MRPIPVILLCSVLAPAAVAADPEAREEAEPYFGWYPWVEWRPHQSPACERNIGGACFDVRPEDASVTIRVENDHGIPTCFYPWFSNETHTVGRGGFCGEATVPVYFTGATYLTVRVGAPDPYFLTSTGVITVTFR